MASRRSAGVALLLSAVLSSALAGCGSGTPPSPSTSTTHPPRAGTAHVAYAGSTQAVNETVVGPAFSRATGYSYQGQGAGSAAISQFLSSGEYTSNVFESVGGGPISRLGSGLTGYYVEFAASPLVIAYNPSGPFASAMHAIATGARPVAGLFDVMSSQGFRLGRTDPAVDPQGQGFLLMLQLAQSQLGVSRDAIDRVVSASQIFAETSLESVLQAGQLDAASAYLPQAVQMHLPYITLPDAIDLGNPADAAAYATASITIPGPPPKAVTGKPLTLDISTIHQTSDSADDAAASVAFVSFVLSPAGQSLYRSAGYPLLTPTLHGSTSAVPTQVLAEIKPASVPTG